MQNTIEKETLGNKLFSFIEENRPLTQEEIRERKEKRSREEFKELTTEIKGNIIGLLQNDIKVEKNDFWGKSVRIYSNRKNKTNKLADSKNYNDILDIDQMFIVDSCNTDQFVAFKSWVNENGLELKSKKEYDDNGAIWAEIFVKPKFA